VLEKLLEETLKKIKPTQSDLQRINHIAKEFSRILKQNEIKFIFGGSYAKGTFLKNIEDIDVYLLIEKEEDVENLKEKLKEIFKELRILHGSRDYFQVDFKGITFEMVPILNIKDVKEVKNSTDLSRFHVEYVKSKIKKNPKLRDEILLFKYFLKQKEIYGAESYNRGISGYLAEVLTIHFGSFLNVIDFFSKARFPINIGINEKIAAELKKEGKLNDFFNVLDPVYEKRNLGMACSIEKISSLIIESKLFLKNPNFKKVDKEKELLEYYKKLDDGYLLIKIEFDNKLKERYLNADIVGSKMKKITQKLINEIKNYYEVYYWVFKYNKKNMEGYSLILVSKSPKIKIKKGPKIFLDNVLDFIEKNKNDLFKIKEDIIFSLNYNKKDLKEIINSLKEREFFDFYFLEKI
jgi:tRNA nucleotidyltransferase (CCA-adding enzyme)